MGVPDDWSRVYSWISADTVILEETAEKKSSYSRKCDEIPILDNYAVSPPDSMDIMRSSMIILLRSMIIMINGMIIMLRGMNIMSCGMIIMLRGVLRKLNSSK
jgi:hypothetical protein